MTSRFSETSNQWFYFRQWWRVLLISLCRTRTLLMSEGAKGLRSSLFRRGAGGEASDAPSTARNSARASDF